MKILLRPGVNWLAMEQLCSKLLIEGLKKIEILKGDTIDLLKKNVQLLFMPHSLGHFLVIMIYNRDLTHMMLELTSNTMYFYK